LNSKKTVGRGKGLRNQRRKETKERGLGRATRGGKVGGRRAVECSGIRARTGIDGSNKGGALEKRSGGRPCGKMTKLKRGGWGGGGGGVNG